jgi:hypothetical protein
LREDPLRGGARRAGACQLIFLLQTARRHLALSHHPTRIAVNPRAAFSVRMPACSLAVQILKPEKRPAGPLMMHKVGPRGQPAAPPSGCLTVVAHSAYALELIIYHLLRMLHCIERLCGVPPIGCVGRNRTVELPLSQLLQPCCLRPFCRQCRCLQGASAPASAPACKPTHQLVSQQALQFIVSF